MDHRRKRDRTPGKGQALLSEHLRVKRSPRRDLPAGSRNTEGGSEGRQPDAGRVGSLPQGTLKMKELLPIFVLEEVCIDCYRGGRSAGLLLHFHRAP
jgi:hypothetical protein